MAIERAEIEHLAKDRDDELAILDRNAYGRLAHFLIGKQGQLKLSDFGLASVIAARKITSAGKTAGTLLYMAPEQIRGADIDARTDLYALGCVLYELLTGDPPFLGSTPATTMHMHCKSPIPRAAEIALDCPVALDQLITRLLAKEPDGRPGSARLILEELTRCQRREPSPAPSTAPVPKAVSAPPVDMTIAGLLIRGRHLWNKRTEDSLRTALRCFQEVTDLDPLQPKAWLGIADTLNLLSNYGIAPPGDSLIRVRAAVAHAVQLEGESGDALRALALAAWQFEFNWEEADALYRRAIELDPTSALTHHWYGVLLGVTRRFDQGIAHFAQAEALDPLSLISLATRGWFTLFAGRPEEAHAILRRVFSLDGSYFPAYWFDGQALAVLGRHEDAIHSLTRATELAGRTSRMLGYLGYVTGLAGRREEALALLAELRGRAADDYVPPYFQALVLAGVAERAEALAELRRALTSRDTMVRDIAIDTPWWSFREEPAYQMLLRELKLLA